MASNYQLNIPRILRRKSHLKIQTSCSLNFTDTVLTFIVYFKRSDRLSSANLARIDNRPLSTGKREGRNNVSHLRLSVIKIHVSSDFCATLYITDFYFVTR